MTYLDICFGYKNLQRFCMVAAFFLCSLSAASQTTRYVTLTGAGVMDGFSWANASSNLQAMINASAANEAVWVAAGTYKPTLDPFGVVPADPRDKTFYVKDGVKIYGGFAGTETLLSQRNITANVTTLSGDFNDDDVVAGSGGSLSITGNGENAYHVVLASADATTGIGVTVDGFTIIGGNASASTNITVNGNPIIRNRGGGIYTAGGTNTLTNNTLSRNSANNYGGGIYTQNGTNTLFNNHIAHNSAGYGGGVCFLLGINTLNNNTIITNKGVLGGGLYTQSGESTVFNNTFAANSGGGLNINNSTNTLIISNTIYDNTISSNLGTLAPKNNNAQHKTLEYNGGGISTFYSNSTLINNTLYNNSAVSNGGGIAMTSSTNILTNNTLYNNSADGNGGGIYISACTTSLNNNIFWDNKKGTDANIAGADYFAVNTNNNTFTNNLLQLPASNYSVSNIGNYAIGTAASGNIFAQNPLFVDATDPDGADNIHRTVDDGLSLQATSPALNVGTATGAPATDITGTSRPQGAGIDIGAYEKTAILCGARVGTWAD